MSELSKRKENIFFLFLIEFNIIEAIAKVWENSKKAVGTQAHSWKFL